MKKSYFLIIGGAFSQENLLKAAKNFFFKTIVIDKNPNCYLSKKADIFIKSDFSKNAHSFKKIKKMNKNIIGVATSASDAGVNLVADINEYYKLNGVTVAQATTINKKIEFRKFQQKYNLPGKIKILKNNFKLQAIKKKNQGSGSQGVKIIKDKKNLIKLKKNFFIEEYKKGFEFGAQVLVSDKNYYIFHGDIMDNKNSLIPIGHYFPGILDNKKINETISITNLYVKKLKFKNVWLNIDYIISKKKIYILEIGARLGATGLEKLISDYHKINIPETIIKLSLGKKINVKLKKNKNYFYGNIGFYPLNKKNVNKISFPNIKKKNILILREKFKFTKLRSGRNIFGFIYAREKSLEKLMIKLEHERRKVIFHERA
jgi:hypothetical protein